MQPFIDHAGGSVRGFSLLEIMMVIMIASLLVSSGFNHWFNYQQKLKLFQVSSQLVAFLQRVQLQANWSNQQYQLQDSMLAGQRVLQVIELASQQRVVRLTFRSSEQSIHLRPFSLLSPVIFYGRRNMASPGHFVIQNDSAAIRVVISAKGRIRRCVESEQMMMGLAQC